MALESGLLLYKDCLTGIVERQLERWRYSLPTVLHKDPTLCAQGLPPLIFAGDAFRHPARGRGGALRVGGCRGAASKSQLEQIGQLGLGELDVLIQPILSLDFRQTLNIQRYQVDQAVLRELLIGCLDDLSFGSRQVGCGALRAGEPDTAPGCCRQKNG